MFKQALQFAETIPADQMPVYVAGVVLAVIVLGYFWG